MVFFKQNIPFPPQGDGLLCVRRLDHGDEDVIGIGGDGDHDSGLFHLPPEAASVQPLAVHCSLRGWCGARAEALGDKETRGFSAMRALRRLFDSCDEVWATFHPAPMAAAESSAPASSRPQYSVELKGVVHALAFLDREPMEKTAEENEEEKISSVEEQWGDGGNEVVEKVPAVSKQEEEDEEAEEVVVPEETRKVVVAPEDEEKKEAEKKAVVLPEEEDADEDDYEVRSVSSFRGDKSRAADVQDWVDSKRFSSPPSTRDAPTPQELEQLPAMASELPPAAGTLGEEEGEAEFEFIFAGEKMSPRLFYVHLVGSDAFKEHLQQVRVNK